MRDVLYITGLLAAFMLLTMDFPSELAVRHLDSPSPAFASFVELPTSVHAAYLESARTSWQVRSGSRGNPVIGSLDSGIPLLADCIPAREKVEFKEIETAALPAGQVDVGEYALMPVSEGVDNPVFSTRPAAVDGGDAVAEDESKPFSRQEMLSVEAFRKIKEIMQ